MKFSPSQLNVYKECPKKWEFVYVHGYKFKGSKAYFDIGNYTHELFHVYYHLLQNGADPGSDFTIAAIKARIANDLANASADNVEVYATVSKTVENYIAHRSRKIDRGNTILAVEGTYEFPVVTPKGREIIFHGIIDLLYKDLRCRTIVRDHKTSGNAGAWNERKVQLDPQLLMYCAVIYKQMGVIPVGEINFINTFNYKKAKPLDELYDLYRVEHTETSLERFWESTLQLIDMMLDSPVVPHYSTSCASCPFNDVCKLELRGISAKQILANNFEVVQRDYSIKRGSGLSADNSENNQQYRFNFGKLG